MRPAGPTSRGMPRGAQCASSSPEQSRPAQQRGRAACRDAGAGRRAGGSVDRITGRRRRFNAMADETLRQFDLGLGEWKVINSLRLAGKPHRRSAGQLAKRSELSSGAMTNRLDRLEEAGLVKRIPDPDDPRGVLVELTKQGDEALENGLGAQAADQALIPEALTQHHA